MNLDPHGDEQEKKQVGALVLSFAIIAIFSLVFLWYHSPYARRTEVVQPEAKPLPIAAATIATVPAFASYVVRRGDNLTRIARARCVSVEALVTTNKLKDPNIIHVGQTLQYKVAEQCSPESAKAKPFPENVLAKSAGASQGKSLSPDSGLVEAKPLPRKQRNLRRVDPSREGVPVPRRVVSRNDTRVNCAVVGYTITDFAQKMLAIAGCIRREYGEFIRTAIAETDTRIEPLLVLAVMLDESRGNPRAISNAKDPCFGLMQLQGPTARQYGVRDVFDPRENIFGGVRVLSAYIFQYQQGDIARGLVSYNAGPHNRIFGWKRFDPSQFVYTQKVMRNYRILKESGFVL